ncbi:MAG: hypothetical protein PHR68_00155 [Candidatus Gracilibacteria bacterium]|nr:hypothetical protein [Candidatus Gracilibacteria bacterium]
MKKFAIGILIIIVISCIIFFLFNKKQENYIVNKNIGVDNGEISTKNITGSLSFPISQEGDRIK